MKSNNKVNEVLDKWQPPYRKDSQLAEKVWEKIEHFDHSEKRSRFREWWSDLIERPFYAIGMAAMLVLCGFLGGSLIPNLFENESDGTVDTVYRQSINPLMRLDSDQDFMAATASLRAPATLKWLQDELDLNPDQFERVVLLHSLYESEFEKVFGELSETKSKFQEMEERRFKDDVIDFFSVNELVKHQKDLEKTSSELTTELLGKISAVLAPEQWERYQSLVGPEAQVAPSDRTDV